MLFSCLNLNRPTGAQIFGPYKDVLINAQSWTTFEMGTKVAGTQQPFVAAVPSTLKTVTLAFASGECGSETWGNPASKVTGQAWANTNIPK